MKAGDRLGDYVLEESLGHGGMAEVFRATRKGVEGFSRSVCVKVIHEALARDPEFVALFKNEADTGSKLHHKNIVSTHDFNQDTHGHYYLVIDFVNGADLDAVLTRLKNTGSRIPTDAGVFIAHELLMGLWQAHSARDKQGRPLHVVHRDVCPDNVLISLSGEVKLADFGIARAAERAQKTQADIARGRLGYMPSEQFQNGEFDSRADLYAAGVTLYELFAGWHPFGKGYPDVTQHTIVAAQVMNLRNPLASLRSDLPSAVVDLIERLLAPSPNDRPQTALDALTLLDPVRAIGNGEQTLAAVMSHLFPGQASTAAIPLRANALVLPPAIARPPLPKLPSNEVVDAYASTALRPSSAPRLDEETAPPFTTDTRGSAPRSSSTGARIPAWTIALTAAVLMAGTALTIARTRGRGRTESTPPITPADPSAHPVTRLNLAAPPAIAEVPAPSAVAADPQPAPEPTPTLPTHASSTHANIATPHPAPTPTVAAPEEAPRPAIRSGTLRVVALPWGEVFVDGTARGRAPVSVTVTAGEHLVRITGGVEHTERVVVIAGATRVVTVDAE